MRELAYTKTAIKDLRSMPSKDSKAIRRKLENYVAGGIEDVVKLKGSEGLYRLRHGNWRAVFEESGVVVAVLKVEKRGEVYR